MSNSVITAQNLQEIEFSEKQIKEIGNTAINMINESITNL